VQRLEHLQMQQSSHGRYLRGHGTAPVTAWQCRDRKSASLCKPRPGKAAENERLTQEGMS
jgi:hypothetical protein